MSHGAELFEAADGTPRVRRGPPGSLAAEADALRHDVVEALHAAGGGHYGGALSILDVVLTLYRRVLRVSPASPRHPDRDRFVLSKGHAAIALYAVLRRLGFFEVPLSSYARLGSPLEGHPDMTTLPGVDFSTGSLGQGLSVGLGMAMALRDTGPQVWVVLGDGECQEGQVWEAAMLAGRHRLGNLHAVVDANGFQECSAPQLNGSGAPPVDSLLERWQAFGWRTLSVPGHDHEALAHRLADAGEASRRPSLVVAHTVKGRGFPLIERDPVRFHCAALTSAEYAELIALGEHA
jgi:transketolase